MPGPALTDSPTWAEITAPPADGDPIAMTAGTAPLLPTVIQKLYDRDRYLHDGPFHGYCETVRSRIVATDAVNRVWTLVSAGRIALDRGDGRIDVFTPSNVTLSNPNIGNFPVSYPGWGFVYGYNNAGVFAVEQSTTEPDAASRFKTGDPSRVYLGTYLVSAEGIAIPQAQVGRSYTLCAHSLYSLPPQRTVFVSGASVVPALAPARALVGKYLFKVAFGAAPSGMDRTAAIRTVGASSTYEVIAPAYPFMLTVDIPIIDGSIELYCANINESVPSATLVGWEE